MLRLIFRVLAWAGLVLFVIVAVVAVYVARNWDRDYSAVPLPDLHASTDPALIARGEYLVRGPAHCVECHVVNFDAYVQAATAPGPVALSGGYRFPIGPLGTLWSRNLTPDRETGIGRYSDPQVARMLRHGVRPDGQVSIPLLMPFGEMSDEDIVSVLSFLRAQPPVKNAVPENEWTLLGKVMRTFVSATKPKMDVHPPKTAPASAPTVERGEYLARSVANCGGCHTAFNELTGAPTVPTFSGGNQMEPSPDEEADPTLWFTPPNITPREKSALLRFPDRATFVARFKVGGRKYPGSPMPWEAFARLSPDDVGALYEFLHTQAPAGAAAPDDPRSKP